MCGFAGILNRERNILGMMPHPERSFLTWQAPWVPEKFRDLKAAPWLQMFQNARTFCLEH